jgi:hypothetical protein
VKSGFGGSIPEARILYLMRDPVERAISHYWHFVAAGRETLPPDRALRERDDYVARSDYAWQIEPYLKRFGEDQVYLLTLEDLQADPRGRLPGCSPGWGWTTPSRSTRSERHNVRERRATADPRRFSPAAGEVPARLAVAAVERAGAAVGTGSCWKRRRIGRWIGRSTT